MHRRHFLASLAALAGSTAQAADPVWRRLQSGKQVILMRHAATVPGIGDPPGFHLGQCATQRNLSDSGCQDARRIGAAFRRHGIPVAAVLSSSWCRCLDTAQLAFGKAETAEMLDSMFRDDEAARRRKLAALRAYVARFKRAGNLVLVTHDVNIRALVGKYVDQGDFLITSVEPDGGLTIEDSVEIASLPR